MKYVLSIICFVVIYAGSLSNTFAQAEDTTITIKVKGITCSTDYKMIESNLEKLGGVNRFQVIKKRATSTFSISFNPEKVSEKEIYAAIEETGSCENPDERPYKVKPK